MPYKTTIAKRAPITAMPVSYNKATEATRAKRYTPELAGPLSGEKYFESTRDFYTNPTATNQYYQQASDFFRQPTISSNLFSQNQAGFFSPGAGESFVGRTYPGMTRAGVGQQFAGSAVVDRADRTGSGNQAQQAWQQFQGRRPVLSQDPGLGAYYDKAKQRAAESIGQRAAAQGVYGSSVSSDQIAEAMTNLEAERANREADYNLKRLAEQRGWEGLGGQLAGQASGAQLGWTTGLGGLGLGAESLGLNREQAAINAALSGDQQALNRLTSGFGVSQGIDQTDLARILGGGQLASTADMAALNRIMSGQQAATSAQTLQEQRALNEFNKLAGLTGLAIPTVSSGFENMFTSDQALMDAETAAMLGAGSEIMRGYQMNRANVGTDIGSALNLYNIFGS